MKKTKFLAIFLFLININYVYGQTGQLGCCTNPGAGILSCSSDKLVSLNQECCPQPETSFLSYYKSGQNQDSPTNYAECSSGFFYPSQGCSAIAACVVGCCCSDLGGSVKPESQCKGTGLTFHKGQTDCNQLCATPQCNDGIDNDNNGCADFSGRDSGCTGAADITELGGKCLSQGLDCNNPNYEPKLSNFEAAVAKGQKKFLLSWEDECKSNSLYYELYRCEGVGCTNFEIISTINKNSFEDTSETLQFGKMYTFKVKSYYSLQSAAAFAVKSGSLGSPECLNQQTSNIFCLNNNAYYCNALNNLVAHGIKCLQSEICIVSNNKPSCFPKSKCEEKKGNPLGLYYTKDGCEKNKWQSADTETYKYCFYDRSKTIIDYCFNCNPSMSCYDYKTQQACQSDNCKLGICEWKPLSTQIEIGACVKKSAYNCEWCEKKGTESLENLISYNEIFDLCTKEKSESLSTDSFKCYFRNDKSTSCESMNCTNYAPEQCSSADIKHDNLNNIINPSNDQCGLKVCQSINNECVKNADGDGKADCATIECEGDYFVPRTTAVAISNKGAVDSIALQIYDKTSFDNSYVVVTGQEYKTYLCMEPCSFEGHPYDISTQSRRIVVSNLNLFDGNNGKKLLQLKEGANSVLYYSQDPSKNIEIVKTLSFEAHENSVGPKVFYFNATNGNRANEKLYTNIVQPAISVKFLEPSVVTYAKLINKNKNFALNLETNNELSAEKNIQIDQNLPDGEYKFELNAKNKNNIFMDTLFVATIVVDTSRPGISISPSKDEVIGTSSALVSLTFSEEARLEKISLNSEDITSKFTTVNNKIFTATLDLNDGNKILEILASDFANNKAAGASSFIVDSIPLEISMAKPKYGISSVYTFDITIETDNEAECRYELDNNLEFEFMSRFASVTGTKHTISSFNKILQNDNSIHKLYVKCNDKKYGPQLKILDVSVDTTPPEIKTAFAYPNPIIERPIKTTLTVETDEPALCTYIENSQIECAKDSDCPPLVCIQSPCPEVKCIDKKCSIDSSVCPQDVKQCPDGSFVSRDPANNCNFRACILSNNGIIPTGALITNMPITGYSIADGATDVEIIDNTFRNPQTGQSSIKVRVGTTVLWKYTDNGQSVHSVVWDTPGPANSNNLNPGNSYSQQFNSVGTFNYHCGIHGPSMSGNVIVGCGGQNEACCTVGSQCDSSLVCGSNDKCAAQQQCTAGECCDTAAKMFKSAGTSCRNSAGVCDVAETCTGSSAACPADVKSTLGCRASIGVCDIAESCDGINNNCPADSFKLSTSVCRISTASCDPEEKCLGSSASCPTDTNSCTSQACSNGIKEGNEECDDGNTNDNDACTNSCKNAVCGDAIVRTNNEQCDTGQNRGACPAACSSSCALNSCTPESDEPKEIDENSFKTINRNTLSLDNEGKYSYSVICQNKAGLNSETKTIDFTADLSKSIIITSHTSALFDSTTAVLAIETNKKAQCKYSETDNTAQAGNLFGASGYSHTKELVLPAGEHKFYIVCKDQYLEQWSNVFEIKFAIDTTGPSMLYVDDNSTDSLPKEKTCNTDRLRVNYLGQDLESGVKEYFYTILKGSQPIVNTINSFTSGEWIWIENLMLEDNTQYFFSAKAKNYAGLTGDSKLSDGITVDTSYCKPSAKCGDSLINQPGEECDTNTFGTIDSCSDFTNFIGGTLKCTNCKLDTSSCTKVPDCGNGQLEPGESCDSTNFGQVKSCNDYSTSFTGGTLKCSSTCQLDTSSCIEKPKCGNSHIDIGESCDGSNLGPLSGKCIDYNPSTFTGGTLACSSCRLDTSGCQGTQGNCGDGIINIGEACDGANLGQIKICADYSSSFEGGTLTCSSACQLNTTGCFEKPKCGNSAIDLGESCDTNNLGPLTGKCLDYSSYFNDGSLKCTNCKLDTNDCLKTPTCGNSRLDTGEACDDSNFGNLTDKSCTSFKDTFNSGTLSCKNCRISTDNCDSNATVAPPITCRDKGSCKINDICGDSSDCESRFCSLGKCAEPSCSDSVKNQDESDSDCGGSCSGKCIDGKSCRFNGDCISLFCSLGKCGDIEACSDGSLGGGEADTDCGGPCPVKCSEGRNCIFDDDCADGLQCASGLCKKTEIQGLDSDGDGLPDEWELQNGLNPNDPTDGEQDPDNDGLTSKEEYELQNIYAASTDPNNADTDNDGYSDKEEIEKNTDPTNPEDFPKSNFTRILLFIAGALILLGGFGYLAYVAVERKRESELRAPRQMPRVGLAALPRQMPRQQFATGPVMPRPMQRENIIPNLRAIEQQKALERKKMFEPFGPEKKQEKLIKDEETKSIPEQEAVKENPKDSSKRRKRTITKKPKEDVFLRLKAIARESKAKKKKAKKKSGKKNASK